MPPPGGASTLGPDAPTASAGGAVETKEGAQMSVMRTVGPGSKLPPHANVREDDCEYVIELDVADFTERELAIETIGPVVTIRGAQSALEADAGVPFRLQERLEESFRLPDDAGADVLTARFRHGVLELRAPRVRLARRAVPVETSRAARVHPDAAAI